MAKPKIDLWLIDPSNSFYLEGDPAKGPIFTLTPNVRCINGAGANWQGELAVPGAQASGYRVRDMIIKHLDVWNAIKVTWDSHRRYDIGHAISYAFDPKNPIPKNIPMEELRKLEKPPIFNQITHDMLLKRHCVPILEKMILGRAKRQTLGDWLLEYTEKSNIDIWPEHCIIGSLGHAFHESINEGLNRWEGDMVEAVEYFVKGDFAWSEHYGAVEAAVPHPEFASTMVKSAIIEMMKKTDLIIIAGQARTHCIPNTFDQVVKHATEDIVKKFIFLEDGSNSVPGFEHLYDDWVNRMTRLHMRITTTDQIHRFF
jgi:nicotinamidase-related amidase